MSCGTNQGLGAQLDRCGAAMCDRNNPVRNWVLADQIQSTRLGAGSEVTVNLRGVPLTDQQGRHAHVVGIRFVGTYRFTVTAGTNSLYAGYQQLAAWSAIFLEDVSGWQYLAAMDGRDLADDRYLRSFRQSLLDAPPDDIAANVGAGNQDVDVSLYWPITRQLATGVEAMQDAIPLVALVAKGDSAFRFKATGQLVGTPTNITAGGFQGTTEIWLEIVYLPDLYIDRPFQLETYLDTNLSGNANRDDRTTEYLCVRHYPEDNGGQYIDDYGASTFQVNGQTIASALTLTQWETRSFAMIADDPDFDDPDPELANAGSHRFGLIVGPTPRTREGMASGVISYQWASRTRTSTRFLQRTIACQRAKRAVEIANAAGCSPTQNVLGVTPTGLVPGGSPMAPLVIPPQTHR